LIRFEYFLDEDNVIKLKNGDYKVFICINDDDCKIIEDAECIQEVEYVYENYHKNFNKIDGLEEVLTFKTNHNFIEFMTFNIYSIFDIVNNLNEMKLCKVSFAHFRNEYNTGIYNTFHSNYENNFTIYYDIPPIKVTLPEIKKKEFVISELNNNNTIYIGADNILNLVTNFNDSISNIFTFTDTDRFVFNTTFSNDKNDKLINGICDLWQPENENTRLICKLAEAFDYGEQNICLNDYSINYNNNKLIFYTDSKNITVKQISKNITILYADKQEININDKISSYELKFKKVSYHGEQLVLYKNKYQSINLNCNDKNTDVICNINKDSLMKILSFNGEKFHVSQLINSEGMLNLNSIFDITINSNNIPKKVINIEITKLLTPFVDMNTYIVYETNIIDIPQITTDYFSISSNKKIGANCLFKKSNENKNDKLLLLCVAENTGEYSLGKINEMTLDNINILYNFKIAETENEEIVLVSEYKSPVIYSVYPEEIDFNKQDSFIISYETDYPERLNSIRLNNLSSGLECEDKIGIKECKVTQAHFTKNGDYNTFIDNSLGYTLILYEIPTIKVTLKEGSDSDPNPDTDPDINPESNDNESYIGIIVASIIGFLVVVGIIIFFVLRYKKKKSGDFEDEKKAPLNYKIELKEQTSK